MPDTPDASDDPGPQPLYAQIAAGLAHRIAAGQLIAGERLPPERRMAAETGVAIGTLRRALGDLAAQGLVERRHGSGNYVRGMRDPGGLYGFFRLERIAGGGLPSAEVTDVARTAKPPGAPPFGTAPDAHRIRRIRRLDGEPVALEEIWLDAAWAATLTPDMLGPALYRVYAQRFGLRIARVEDRVGLGALPGWGAAALGLPPGAAVGHVARLGWAQTGARAEFSHTWFDPARARYVARHR